jgi:hypothetical protein
MLFNVYAPFALGSALLVAAHGEHSFDMEDGEDALGYAERHVSDFGRAA